MSAEEERSRGDEQGWLDGRLPREHVGDALSMGVSNYLGSKSQWRSVSCFPCEKHTQLAEHNGLSLKSAAKECILIVLANA